MPRNAHTVVAQFWNSHTPGPSCIHLEKWLLADDWCPLDLRVRWFWPFACRWMRHSHEHHVPVRAGPTAPFTVARDPLLLRSRAHIAIHQRVRHPATAGPPAVLVQYQISAHVHAPE